MEASSDVRKLLTESGFLACMMNDTGRAQRIFDGLKVFDPDGAGTLVGASLIAMTQGDHESAIGSLRPLAEAGSPEAAAILAVAMKLAGHQDESDAWLARAGAKL